MPFLGKQPTAGFASIVKDDFTADGSTTAFTLSKNVASANDIAVFVGNVRQEPTDAYSVSGTTLTMSAAPSSGVNFYVLHIAGTHESSVVPADGTITNSKLSLTYTTSTTATGDGSTTGYTISSGHNVESVLVVYNGVILTPTTDYTVSGTTLTFVSAPVDGSEVVIRYLPV